MTDQTPDPQPEDPRSQDDPAERWGRVVGRALGYGFALLLLLDLVRRWAF